jgi:hypothetical protein
MPGGHARRPQARRKDFNPAPSTGWRLVCWVTTVTGARIGRSAMHMQSKQTSVAPHWNRRAGELCATCRLLACGTTGRPPANTARVHTSTNKGLAHGRHLQGGPASAKHRMAARPTLPQGGMLNASHMQAKVHTTELETSASCLLPMCHACLALRMLGAAPPTCRLKAATAGPDAFEGSRPVCMHVPPCLT